MEEMLAHADIIVTARSNGRLVGVSRAITDFSFCTYLSDLAVDRGFQRQGIGKELIRRTHDAAGLHTTLILLSAPNGECVLCQHRNGKTRFVLGDSTIDMRMNRRNLRESERLRSRPGG